MRITTQSQSSFAKYTVSAAYAELAKAQQMVSTGKRFTKPSDDPVAVDQSLSYTQSIKDIDQFVRNTNVGKDFLGQTSTVVDELYTQLQEMRNIGLSANTATATAESRQSLAARLETIKNRMVDLAKTKHLGRSLFSGQKTDVSPLAYLHTLQGSSSATAAVVDGTGNLSGTTGSLTTASLIGGVGAGNAGDLVFEDLAGNITGAVSILATDTDAEVISKINAQMQSLMPSDGITASAGAGGAVVLTQNTASAGAAVRISDTSTAALLTRMGLTAEAPGQSVGSGGMGGAANAGNLVFEDSAGNALVTVALDGSEDLQGVVDKINAAVSGAGLTPPDTFSASVNGNGIRLQQNTAGSAPIIRISNTSTANTLTTLGLTAETTYSGGGTFSPQGTAGILTIEGVDINILANDTSQALVNRINLQTTVTKVTAAVDGSGRIFLTKKDPASTPVIDVSASGGYTINQIFGGPVSETYGDTYTYYGDQGNIKLQVGPGLVEPMNYRADTIFNLDGAASGNEPDLFALIDTLKSAVISGDKDQLAEKLTLVEKASSRMLVNRVDIGGKLKNVEQRVTYLENTQDTLKELRSKAEDADIAEAIVKLQTQQQVYQASLYSASTMFNISLLNYMK